MSGTFPDLLLTRMDVAKEVDIETRDETGVAHKVTIWIVVHDGAAYVRSVRGKKGRWYRELVARKQGVLHVGSRSVEVRPTAVRGPEVIDLVSAALWRKYPKSASLFSMLRLATLDTTLRLDPA
ncbi:MAG TPA: DUF2255 family protein [Candidatus Limnocylindrales bacterium]|nr:DUF2255 family protein [Candidatus Limnocylindrales bacterium]